MAEPNFLSPTINPFGLTDVGRYAVPIFADIDGDGDSDAFIGAGNGKTMFFRNTGTDTAPTFTEESDNFGLTDVGSDAAPSFVDIDGDGDFDAFVGTSNGNTKFFRNTGTDAAPSFTRESDNFGLTDVGRYASPTFADIDGDGDFDAFVGARNGNTQFFRNTGTDTAPAFTRESDNFGLTDVGRYAAPTFADIDGDGDLDAFVGDKRGNTEFFRNTGTETAPSFTEESNNFGLTDVGRYAAPTLADLDGDGDFDAFVGAKNGKTQFFENDPAPVAVDDEVSTDEDSLITGSVLANDTDPQNDTLTVIEVNGQAADVGTEITLDSGALLTIEADGSYSYDPNGQFEDLNDGDTATDSFTYTISDGSSTDTATVTVTIDGVDEAPELPPNTLESDYTIFSHNVNDIEYTVEVVDSQAVYKIDDITTDGSLNDFLSEVVSALGGTVVKNGTVNENSLEHFGGSKNPSIRENESADDVIIKIAGSGVGGQFKADFDNDGDANAFQSFARDLLGKDPTKTEIFEFNGGTNGGNNTIRILRNEEIVDLNPELSDGLRTADSLDFTWSGADTSGTQKLNNFDDFIGEMGDLFGGDQLMNGDIHVIPTLNEAELMGSEVEISNGIGDSETWSFGSEEEAQNFLSFFNSTVDAFALEVA